MDALMGMFLYLHFMWLWMNSFRVVFGRKDDLHGHPDDDHLMIRRLGWKLSRNEWDGLLGNAFDKKPVKMSCSMRVFHVASAAHDRLKTVMRRFRACFRATCQTQWDIQE